MKIRRKTTRPFSPTRNSLASRLQDRFCVKTISTSSTGWRMGTAIGMFGRFLFETLQLLPIHVFGFIKNPSQNLWMNEQCTAALHFSLSVFGRRERVSNSLGNACEISERAGCPKGDQRPNSSYSSVSLPVDMVKGKTHWQLLNIGTSGSSWFISNHSHLTRISTL